MATTASEIADYLDALASITYEVRVGKTPPTPDKVLVVREYSGAPPNMGLGVDGVQHEMPGIQVIVRGAPLEYEEARGQIETAYQELAKIQAETLGSTFYLMVRPQHSPFELDTDDRDRTRFACSFLAEKEPTAQ